MNKMEGKKLKEAKLEHSNAEMASSATTPFDTLPDEIALKILDLTAWSVSADDDYKWVRYL